MSAEPQPRFVMKEHAIFDTSVNAFIGAGDACYLLNETIDALAAEQKRADDSIEENVRLLNRLAEEREKYERSQEKVRAYFDQLAADNAEKSAVRAELAQIKLKESKLWK